MKKALILLVLVLLITLSLFGDSSYGPGHVEVVWLRRLYHTAGRSFPVSHYPLYPSELHSLAITLKAHAPNLIPQIDLFIDSLTYKEASLNLSGYVFGSYEHQFDSRSDYFPGIDQFLTEPAIFKGRGDFYRDGQGGFSIQMNLQRHFDRFIMNNWFVTEDHDLIAMENQFVERGVFYFQIEDLYLGFGRDVVHFGEGLWSSFYPSSRLPFLDSFSVRYHLGPVTMSALYSTLENRKANQEQMLPLDPLGLNFEKNIIVSAVHRFSYNHSWFKTSIGALSLISRPLNGFHLADFFPVFSWHNADIGRHNLSLVVDFEAVPVPGFSCYFQGAFDDINISELTNGYIGDSSLPTIWAYMAGVSYFLNLNAHFKFTFMVETGGTHYLWGNFHDGKVEENLNYPLAKAVYRVHLDGGNQYLPYTSPYGPGTFWLDESIRMESSFGLSAILNGHLLWYHREINLIDTPYKRDDSVYESDNWGINGDIKLRVEYRPFFWVTIWAEPAWIYDDGIHAAHLDLGVSFQYTGQKKWILD